LLEEEQSVTHSADFRRCVRGSKSKLRLRNRAFIFRGGGGRPGSANMPVCRYASTNLFDHGKGFCSIAESVSEQCEMLDVHFTRRIDPGGFVEYPADLEAAKALRRVQRLWIYSCGSRIVVSLPGDENAFRSSAISA